MRVFILERPFEGNEYPLEGKESRYLTKALRMEPGRTITARDSSGRWWEATLSGPSTLLLKPSGKPGGRSLTDTLSAHTGKIPPIEVAQCICKGRKNETIARMLTEAGVKRIVFSPSAFSQERTIDSHGWERIRSVSREAAQQSGAEPPELVLSEKTFTQTLSSLPRAGLCLILHQSSRSRTRLLGEVLSEPFEGLLRLCVGPEGGFSDEECLAAEDMGARPTLLPTNILRAETAGIFAVGAAETILAQ